MQDGDSQWGTHKACQWAMPPGRQHVGTTPSDMCMQARVCRAAWVLPALAACQVPWRQAGTTLAAKPAYHNKFMLRPFQGGERG